MKKIIEIVKTKPYWAFFFLFSIVSLLLIENYQIPWFDEVYYADISLDFLKNHTFFSRIDAIHSSAEVLIYGPVYFVLSALSFKVLGFGLWQFRLLALLSGLALIAIFLKKIAYLTNFKYALLFLLLIISDRAINFSLHSGRMDMLAALFLSLTAFVFGSNRFSSGLKILVSGLFLSLACLTTMRIFFFLPCLIFLPLVGENFAARRKIFFELLGLAAVVSITYLAWLMYAYDSLTHLVNYVQSILALNQHLANNWLWKLFRKFYEAPKFSLFYLSVIYLLYSRKIKNLTIGFLIALIFSFLIGIDEAAPYRAMILPMVYFIIIYALYEISKTNLKRRLKYGIAGLLLGILILNTVLLSARYAVIFRNWNAISHTRLEKIIQAHIPPNSKIVGEFKYYYACKKLNCEFISAEFMSPQKSDFIRNRYKPDFVLSSEKNTAGKQKITIPMFVDSHYFFPLDKIVKGEGLLNQMYYGGYIFCP